MIPFLQNMQNMQNQQTIPFQYQQEYIENTRWIPPQNFSRDMHARYQQHPQHYQQIQYDAKAFPNLQPPNISQSLVHPQLMGQLHQQANQMNEKMQLARKEPAKHNINIKAEP